MDNLIQFNNVVKQYNNKRVLDYLTVTIPPRRVVGLLGPNGAGKSTMLKMIVNLIKPDQGEVEVFSSPPSWQNNRQIAYLPDGSGWYSFHTIAKAFAYGETVFPGFDHSLAIQLAGEMKLDLHSPISSLSKGEQACLRLILSLARDIPLVLLDEPFDGIDMIAREKMMDAMIQTVMEREQTILLSTHQVQEVEGLLDYVVFLCHGRVAWAGSVEELRASRKVSVQSLYREVLG